MHYSTTTLRQRRRDLAIVYRDLVDVEARAQDPIVMTPGMIEAGVTEEKVRQATEARLRDARQQFELAKRRIAVVVRSAGRRPSHVRPHSKPPRRPACRQRARSRATPALKSSGGDSGDGEPEPEPPGDRRSLPSEVAP